MKNTYRSSINLKFSALLLLVALCDQLIYSAEADVGWPRGLIQLLTLLGLLAFNPGCLKTALGPTLAVSNMLLGFALIYDASPLARLLSTFSLLALAVLSSGREPASFFSLFLNSCNYYSFGLLRLPTDLNKLFARTLSLRSLFSVMFFLSIFVFLLAKANPLLAKLIEMLTLWRLLYALLCAMLLWQLLRARPEKCRRWKGKAFGRIAALPGLLFIDASHLSLALYCFNALLLFQNVSDLLFLWSGRELPADISYAEYAHRGAYSLVCTALLAAAITLTTFRESRKAELRKTHYTLVYVWLGQNLFLLLSCVLRLSDYVTYYGSLTGWRIAGFIWLALVAFGLFSIVLRLRLDFSNRLLLNVNVAAVYLTLVVSAFINFSGFIASYNLRHLSITKVEMPFSVFVSVAINEQRVPFGRWDLDYLKRSISYPALPALVSLQKNCSRLPSCTPELEVELNKNVLALRQKLEKELKDFRAWTLQKYFILRDIQG